MEVVEAGGILVDDCVPVAVEGGRGAVVDVDKEGVGLGLERYCACEDGKECGEEEAGWDLRHSDLR
jgi:hypothetical protein